MPRQSFLSTEFFVTATEEEAKQAVSIIPLHLSQITLLKENALANSMRFLYEHPEKQLQNYLDVSILPLNNLYTCFSLHGSYTNGHAFHSDHDIANALKHFELAVQASLKNDFSSLQIIPKTKTAKKGSWQFARVFGSIFLPKHWA